MRLVVTDNSNKKDVQGTAIGWMVVILRGGLFSERTWPFTYSIRLAAISCFEGSRTMVILLFLKDI